MCPKTDLGFFLRVRVIDALKLVVFLACNHNRLFRAQVEKLCRVFDIFRRAGKFVVSIFSF